MLYVKLQKALYGCLCSASLFYRKLWADLEGYGFRLNRCDPCVANKNVGGWQLTITWHVDDLKISQKSKAVVDEVINRLKSIYGDIRITRGLKHDYLGIDLEFTEDRTVKVSMVNFLKKVIEEFPEVIKGSASSPAMERLFDVRADKERSVIEEERAVAFHHTVAQLLFAAA